MDPRYIAVEYNTILNPIRYTWEKIAKTCSGLWKRKICSIPRLYGGAVEHVFWVLKRKGPRYRECIVQPRATYWVRPKQSDRIPANKFLKHFALIEEFCMLIQISKKFVLTWTVQLTFVGIGSGNGPLTRYEKLRVAHAPGMPGTFSPPQRVSDPDIPTFSAHAQPAILRIW